MKIISKTFGYLRFFGNFADVNSTMVIAENAALNNLEIRFIEIMKITVIENLLDRQQR